MTWTFPLQCIIVMFDAMSIKSLFYNFCMETRSLYDLKSSSKINKKEHSSLKRLINNSSKLQNHTCQVRLVIYFYMRYIYYFVMALNMSLYMAIQDARYVSLKPTGNLPLPIICTVEILIYGDIQALRLILYRILLSEDSV